MDIERIGGVKNKVTFNHNRERTYLFGLIPPQLGRLARICFAVKRTFSEDLSEKPLSVTLEDTAVHGLHEAIQQRIADLQEANLAGRSFQTPESFTLEQAANKLTEFTATSAQEAA